MQSEKIPPKIKSYVLASIIGNGLEWYDFSIFGYFAPIFAKQFFPTASPVASMINTFVVFAVGFLSRPLGAYIFGRIGDQMGRKAALLYSMLLMAGTTTLMGLLPNYAQIGILAPILLTTLRILQGISIGGEFTNSLSYLLEHSPKSRKGLLVAWSYTGGFLGGALGASIGALTTSFTTTDQLYSFGWRIPFVLGFAIAAMGYYLRRKMQETPLFLELVKNRRVEKSPFSKALKENRSDILLGVGMLLPTTVWTYFLFVYIPTYLTEIKEWNFSLSLFVNLLPNTILIALVPITGHLSDILGRKKIIVTGLVILLATAPITLMGFSLGSILEIALLQAVIAIPLSFCYGPISVTLVDMFPISIRSTSVSITYHIATGVFGGLTPLIISWLSSMNAPLSGPLIWLGSTSLIGLISVCTMKNDSPPVLANP